MFNQSPAIIIVNNVEGCFGYKTLLLFIAGPVG